MTGALCTWCDKPIPQRKPPLPEGFCSEPCAACYKVACADVGAELHRTGTISIENLRARFRDRCRRRAARDQLPGPSLVDQVAAAVPRPADDPAAWIKVAAVIISLIAFVVFLHRIGRP